MASKSTASWRDYKYLFKLVMLGTIGTGKSSLMMRFSDDQFSETSITTLGVDCRFRNMEVDGTNVKLEILDTAGWQRIERNKEATPSYFTNAHGIVLVYDMTDEQSFLSVRDEIDWVQQNAAKNIRMILIANKRDLEKKRVVTRQRGENLAEEFGMKFYETSAKTAEYVREAFDAITKNIMEQKISTEIAECLIAQEQVPNLNGAQCFGQCLIL